MNNIYDKNKRLIQEYAALINDELGEHWLWLCKFDMNFGSDGFRIAIINEVATVANYIRTNAKIITATTTKTITLTEKYVQFDDVNELDVD